MKEHIAANSVIILTSNISIEEKNAFFAFAKDALLKETSDLEKDARYQLMVGSFFSTTGLLDEALTHLTLAQELMPSKQQIYFEIGAVYINKNDPKKAFEVFKQAYDLAPEYKEAGSIYLIGAIYAGDRLAESKMISELTEREVVFDDRVINAYNANDRTDRVVSILEERIRLDPSNTDKYREYIKSVTN